MDVFAWGNSRAIEKKNIMVPQVGFVHAEDVLKTQEVVTGHLTEEENQRGREEGAREKKNKCHYWFGVETEQASTDLQLTAAATRNKKREKTKTKAASDCDPGVNVFFTLDKPHQNKLWLKTSHFIHTFKTKLQPPSGTFCSVKHMQTSTHNTESMLAGGDAAALCSLICLTAIKACGNLWEGSEERKHYVA